jgi:hypothetical protein
MQGDLDYLDLTNQQSIKFTLVLIWEFANDTHFFQLQNRKPNPILLITVKVVPQYLQKYQNFLQV